MIDRPELIPWDETKARMTEQFIAEGREDLLVHRCEKCRTDLSDSDSSTHGTCRAGNCTTVLCGACGYEWASFGPVGCECQSRDPRLRKVRAMYRRRKR